MKRILIGATGLALAAGLVAVVSDTSYAQGRGRGGPIDGPALRAHASEQTREGGPAGEHPGRGPWQRGRGVRAQDREQTQETDRAGEHAGRGFRRSLGRDERTRQGGGKAVGETRGRGTGQRSMLRKGNSVVRGAGERVGRAHGSGPGQRSVQRAGHGCRPGGPGFARHGYGRGSRPGMHRPYAMGHRFGHCWRHCGS